MPHRFHTVAPEHGNSVPIQPNSSTHTNDDNHDALRIPRDEIDANDFKDYAVHILRLENAYIQQLDVVYPRTRRQSTWKKTCEMPRWLLLLLANCFIILLTITFCVVFIYKESIVSNGQACLQNSNCNSYTGLICTAGTCSCSSVYFWDGLQCVPQRTFNRTCTSQNQCDSLAKLLCMNITIGLDTDLFCWCSNYRYWTGNQCVNLKTFHNTCSSDYECDFHDYLICTSGQCDCNSTQFWNNVYCENKRSYGDQCFSTYWCNNATADLACSTWAPTAGTCDCLSNHYWWSGNQTCLPQLPLNATCSFTYECLTNQSLYCSSNASSNSCQCAEKYWYNSTKCTPKFLESSSCTSSLQCDDTVLLTCNSTSHICSCDESNYIWDGIECVVRRSIGGECSSNSECLANQNLICDTTGIWNNTCACPTNYYWNTSISVCVLKKLWYQTCSTSYECYDGGYLSCQLNAVLNTTACDCANYTYYWTGFLNNTYNDYCTPKIGYNMSFTCVSSYQCEEYNLLSCIASECQCASTLYWSNSANNCTSKQSYGGACASNAECLTVPGAGLSCISSQCDCLTGYTWDSTAQQCAPVG